MSRYWCLIGLVLCTPWVGVQAQMQEDCSIGYEMKRVLPAHSVKADRLTSANSISDFVKHFEQSWVRDYHAVTITTVENGLSRSAAGSSDVLTKEQIALLQTADSGANVELDITYIPDNTLESNDLHTLSYSVNLIPEIDAAFPAGGIEWYLSTAGVTDVIHSVLDPCDMVAVIFVVDDQGSVTDVELSHSQFYTDKYEKLEGKLMEAICAMPKWDPAKYKSGATVSQKHVIMVGNQQSCITNFFNISEEWN